MDLDLLVVLDRSGSMQDAKADHEGGLRSFLEDQRQLAGGGGVRFTLVQFDTHNPCEVVYDRTPIAEVGRVELIPRGGTPLLDAVGRAVSHLRAKVMEPANVIALIITDGQENASVEWTKDRVKSLVTELEAKNWSFLFLGANVDAFAEGRQLGVGAARTMNFANRVDVGTVQAAYAATSVNVAGARGVMTRGASMTSARSLLRYTDVQRMGAALQEDRHGTVSREPDGTVSSGRDCDADEEAEG